MPTRKRGTGGPAFTVAMPHDLPVRKGERDAWWLDLPERELRLSNLDKVFWPEEAITKGDVIAYYANVADLLLPHLEHRPLTMKRMPDGIDGDAFYEKTAPSHTPEWVHRCTVLSEDAKAGRIDYLTVDDLPTLLFVANLGAIEMHPLHSRCEDVEHPGLPLLRPRSVPAVHLRGRPGRRAPHPRAARRLRHDRASEDLGRDGPADLRAARTRLRDLCRGARLRRRVRQPDQAGRPRPRDDGLARGRPLREDLHRPQHEPPGREHRGRLLAAPRAARPRLDAPDAGTRSRPAGSSRRTSGSTTSGSGSRPSATCGTACGRARPPTSPPRSTRSASRSRRTRSPGGCRARQRRASRRRPRTRSRSPRRTPRCSSTCVGASSARRARPSPHRATRPAPATRS